MKLLESKQFFVKILAFQIGTFVVSVPPLFSFPPLAEKLLKTLAPI